MHLLMQFTVFQPLGYGDLLVALVDNGFNEKFCVAIQIGYRSNSCIDRLCGVGGEIMLFKELDDYCDTSNRRNPTSFE